MNKRYAYAIFFSLLMISACAAAFLVYALNNQWIMITFPMRVMHEHVSTEAALTKKCVLWYWHADQWCHEEVELLWHEELSARVHILLSRWLTVLQEEQVWPEYTALQTVITAQTQGHLYCSFERSPFNAQMSMHDKLFWLEGLLKTVRLNENKVRAVQVLVQHQPIIDAHIALNCWWPIEGYMQ